MSRMPRLALERAQRQHEQADDDRAEHEREHGTRTEDEFGVEGPANTEVDGDQGDRERRNGQDRRPARHDQRLQATTEVAR